MFGRGLGIAVGAAAALTVCAGCGGLSRTAEVRTGTMAGTVSATRGSFCVARHEAKGFCIRGVDAHEAHVGECVLVGVTWQPSQGAEEDPSGVTSIRHASAREHPDDC